MNNADNSSNLPQIKIVSVTFFGFLTMGFWSARTLKKWLQAHTNTIRQNIESSSPSIWSYLIKFVRSIEIIALLSIFNLLFRLVWELVLDLPSSSFFLLLVQPSPADVFNTCSTIIVSLLIIALGLLCLYLYRNNTTNSRRLILNRLGVFGIASIIVIGLATTYFIGLVALLVFLPIFLYVINNYMEVE